MHIYTRMDRVYGGIMAKVLVNTDEYLTMSDER